jgi:peptide/nickel transport system substrate-binding protein
LREAVSLAIDRELIVNSVIGTGTPAKWPWVSGFAYNADSEGYEHDMEKAQELVKASNYDGSEISLLCSSQTTTRVNELAQAVQSELLEAGFNVKINMVEEATYDTLRPAGEYDIAIGVFNTNTGDAYKEICEIIGGDIFCTNYVDDELQALVADVEGNIDHDSRQAAEIAVYQHIMDNYGPYLYLYCTTGIVAANDKLDLDSIRMDGSGTWRIARAQMK